MAIKDDLQVLVGEKLSAITFVLDYWQLNFDGTICFTVYSRLTVEAEGVRIRDGDAGFRDLICDRIGQLVADVELTADFLAFGFADGSRIEASSRDDDYNGPEAIQFSFQGRLYVW
jgi:hypothetical protein